MKEKRKLEGKKMYSTKREEKLKSKSAEEESDDRWKSGKRTGE